MYSINIYGICLCINSSNQMFAHLTKRPHSPLHVSYTALVEWCHLDTCIGNYHQMVVGSSSLYHSQRIHIHLDSKYDCVTAWRQLWQHTVCFRQNIPDFNSILRYEYYTWLLQYLY